MSLDPRTPVIIGVGQRSQRVDRGEPELEPVDLMVVAGRAALEDASVTDASAIDSVRTVGLLSWRYTDPGSLVAERLGVGHPIDSGISAMGGNSPQMLLNQTALDIQAGEVSCVLLAGAESWRTRSKYRATGENPPWTTEPEGTEPAREIGTAVEMNHEAETALGIFLPIQVYPMFEQARRHHLGRTMDEHLPILGGLWSRFSEVAAKNPHAWIQEAMTPEEIVTPSPTNRMVGMPYTKVMNSNNAVEQSAAVLVCSVEVAERLGVPRDRWVFPLAGSDAHEHPYVSHRDTLYTAPAVGIAGRAALAEAGLTIDDIDHVDLYSCFPVAVQVGADELGLDLDRQLTLTGGLSFAGGPWNNYVMHSIAATVDALRDDPGSTGLVWANGGYLTKHAFGIYSTEPPAEGFRHAHPQDEIDALPSREVAPDHEGEATVETWTVMHGKDGQPEQGIVAMLLDDGRRAWGTTDDADTLATMVAEDIIERRVHRTAEGRVSLLD
ncbi:acetyl-CoA acetyltransferase [Acidimicrobiia bacterium EGI L10123]|uniref:acetyl-CoA acetyltransferase n=1 Tax=Salinilacustrithrix flava TaxID=2957203 RepID=UPI003D7C2FC6|nr:acetyl-CoA acetyltransferase [Acidimicrobiia bacterium EGI L10123]